MLPSQSYAKMKVSILVLHSALNLCTSVADITVSASSEHALIFIAQIMSWWLLKETDTSMILKAWMTSWTDHWFRLICHSIFSSVYVYWLLLLYYKHFYEAAQSTTCLSAKWSSGRVINVLIYCTSVWKVCTWKFIFRILGFSKMQLFGILVTCLLFCLAKKVWKLLLHCPSWQMFSC
jgi:hypothetical protein